MDYFAGLDVSVKETPGGPSPRGDSTLSVGLENDRAGPARLHFRAMDSASGCRKEKP
jgi:hypothetical protein